ncbi:MAG: hypothetical protein ACRCU1_03530 [Alsobacter sp.]
MIYTTAVGSAQVHPSGWLPFGDGLEITAAPLIDADEAGLFARLTYRDALAVAGAMGARLLSLTEHDKLWRTGRRLMPIIKTPGQDMASLEYARQHDAELFEQLKSWDGKAPLANAGKMWVMGAAAGRALNYGWWDAKAPNGLMWQTLGTRHDDGHTDYSQLTMLVRPRRGGLADIAAPFVGLAEVAATIRRAMPSFGSLSLGERCLYVARAELAQNIREIPGPKAHPRIREYLAGCRRGGSPRAGMPGHELEGGKTLGPSPSDELHWCAASGSMCALLALQPGEDAPHGYRAAVWECVEDARAMGRLRLRGEGYQPKLGDVVISARGGGDPLKRGSGHYERVSQLSPLRTIGGNEAQNTWVEDAHRGEEDPSFRAWIAIS